MILRRLELRSLHADGGPTANHLLMQITADITGVELRVAASPDCSPLGAALAGMLGLGIHGSLAELAALPRAETQYRANLSAETVGVLHAGWLAAVRRVTAPSHE